MSFYILATFAAAAGAIGLTIWLASPWPVAIAMLGVVLFAVWEMIKEDKEDRDE